MVILNLFFSCNGILEFVDTADMTVMAQTEHFIEFLYANRVDPDQTPHFAASDLGLHCSPKLLLWINLVFQF